MCGSFLLSGAGNSLLTSGTSCHCLTVCVFRAVSLGWAEGDSDTALCLVGFWFSQRAMSSAGAEPRGAVAAGVLTLVRAEELLALWLWLFWQITFSGLI